jgi:hypothetical protein
METAFTAKPTELNDGVAGKKESGFNGSATLKTPASELKMKISKTTEHLANRNMPAS